jgi:alkylhydroperoxidase/carboxymuconolactone decarboxylase family protein YurZ
MKSMNQNPYEIFQTECPEVAAGFSDLIEAQKALKGLDTKTKQLVNIAIQTANRNRGTDACNDGKKRVQPVKRLPVQWY